MALDSPSALRRLEAIRAVQAAGGPSASLRPLLDDEAPYLFEHGGRSLIGELRFAALTALQALGVRDLGEVTVRKAMPAAQAQRQALAAMAAMPSRRREELLRNVQRYLDERVQPSPDELEALRAYRVLQELGRVPYRREPLDPDSGLTSLQLQVLKSQMASERPRPHLRVDGPGFVLGYVYRQDGRWLTDFCEHPQASAAEQRLRQIMRLDHGVLPRVQRDEDGKPLRNPDGSLKAHGTVARSGPDSLAFLDSLAAFAARALQVELVA